MGGTFLGYGVQCYEGICDGACCAPDGTCTTTYREACTDEFIGEGVGCDTSPCELPCEEVGCAPCSCCVEGECVEAVCPSPTVDSASWCSITALSPAGTITAGSPFCSGTAYCEETETQVATYDTQYLVEYPSLVESVACGGTQTTSPGSFPSIPSGNCRYIYRMAGGFGQSASSLSDSCKVRYWWGYIDVDPCLPTGSNLTMVEDTAAAINNSTISDCTSANTPGCRSDCDTDSSDCFSTPPTVAVSFPP